MLPNKYDKTLGFNPHLFYLLVILWALEAVKALQERTGRLQPLICFNCTPVSREQISCSSKLYSAKPRSWHRIRSYSDWKHNRLASFPQWRGHTSFYIYYKSMNKKTNIYASNHRHKFSQFLFGCLHSYKPIVDYIDTQFENYLQEELKIKRSLFNYHDTRIHICLYFIAPTGHSLKSLDLVTMKKLDSKVQTKAHIHSHTCKLWSHTPGPFLIVWEELSAWLKSDLPLTERCHFTETWRSLISLQGCGLCPNRIKQRLALSTNISKGSCCILWNWVN